MGGIEVTSQRRGSGEINNAASDVNSSIAQDLRGLLVDRFPTGEASAHWQQQARFRLLLFILFVWI